MSAYSSSSPSAEELATRLRRSVVAIQSATGAGSGTVVGPGLVATNNHVIRAGAGSGLRVTPSGPLPSMPARVLHGDASSDLALLRVDGLEAEPLALAAEAALRPGQLVFALGNPWGEPGVLTAGVLLSADHQGDDMLRADIRLAPGNSGGPLVDAGGMVLGINTMVAGGLALAVPAKRVAALIERSRESAPGWLGIAVRPVVVNVEGREVAALLVVEVQASSAASSAGLMLGDVVLALAGSRGHDAMLAVLGELRANQALSIDLLRGGSPLSVRVTPAFRSAA